MGSTNIEWAVESWNPVTGCTPVSAGCANCYARRMANRLRGRCGYPADDPFRVTLHEDRLDEPLHWRKPRQPVFVCSMGDLFHDDVPTEYIDRVLSVVEECKQHTFIVLTKRPENIDSKMYGGSPCRLLGGGDYLENLWLGVSVEDQKTADERIPLLLLIPAAKHIVSYEPALGPVDYTRWFWSPGSDDPPFPSRRIGGLIIGGETGPGARPFDLDWATSAVSQGRAAGVPVFVKQLGQCPKHYYRSPADGQLRNYRQTDGRGKNMDEWPGHLRVREWPE